MILASASKLVLLLMSASLVALTWVGKVDPKDFVAAALMVLTYYFSKATPSGPTNTL